MDKISQYLKIYKLEGNSTIIHIDSRFKNVIELSMIFNTNDDIGEGDAVALTQNNLEVTNNFEDAYDIIGIALNSSSKVNKCVRVAIRGKLLFKIKKKNLDKECKGIFLACSLETDRENPGYVKINDNNSDFVSHRGIIVDILCEAEIEELKEKDYYLLGVVL